MIDWFADKSTQDIFDGRRFKWLPPGLARIAVMRSKDPIHPGEFILEEFLLPANKSQRELGYISNGRVEGFNRKAKLIQRRGFGLKNFKNYRLVLLNACR